MDWGASTLSNCLLKQKHIFNTYKVKLTHLKEKTEIFTNTVGNFNTSLLTIDKIKQKNINIDIKDLNNITNKIDLIINIIDTNIYIDNGYKLTLYMYIHIYMHT